MKIASSLLITSFAALFVLLALQAEPITATLGYVSAGLLVVALIVSLRKPNA